MDYRDTRNWLPTSLKEVRARGWEQLDVIIFSGDAYVDHPSFGPAVVGRIFESLGLKVALVPQPNWRDDLRDFKKLGIPRLFFAVSPGCMDSMVNHYTANRRRRSDDAYTAGGISGMRPDMPTIVYTKILKELYPQIPVIIGGIEASLRRLTHYDYWTDKLKPSILVDSGADLLIYGMGEEPIFEIIRLLKRGVPFHSLTNVMQTAISIPKGEKYATNKTWEILELHSYEDALKDKKKHAQNFRHIEEESNKIKARLLTQDVGDKTIVVNPPFPIMSSKSLDSVYELPFTRLPHPRYKNKEVPAYNMIRHSINIHRGCFGGCSFCTISAHQGKFIVSRSPQSIKKEVEDIVNMPDFRGTISDVGGPSANMYAMSGINKDICAKCARPSCIFPKICSNLNTDHSPISQIYDMVSSHEKVKHCFIGSGIRYDIALHKSKDEKINRNNKKYMEKVISKHVSGRFKVAPEHTSDRVLNIMRKPSFNLFYELKKIFDEVNKKQNLKQQLIPYFISSHPGCMPEDMAELACKTKDLDFKLEQVQDFTPTPMTVATTIYYSGFHPYTLKPVFTAISKEEKNKQNSFFFWYKKENKSYIIKTLKDIKREDLIVKIYPNKRK